MRLKLWCHRTTDVQPLDGGGRQAREETQRSVERTREVRREVAPVLAWLRRDYERNHYAEALVDLFGGDRP